MLTYTNICHKKQQLRISAGIANVRSSPTRLWLECIHCSQLTVAR